MQPTAYAAGADTTMDIPFDRVRRWTFDQALPFWAGAGVDRINGGYVEQFDFEGADAGAAFKRTRVTCRQIFVFSHAAAAGWAPGLDAARHGYDFLIDRARLGNGGWARTVSREGHVLDPTPDLYDLAFVVFALSWFYRASSEREALEAALQTLEFIDSNLTASHGGYLAALPAAGPRLQNPHMHLLEAALAGFEASGEDAFKDLAARLINLFETKFYDWRSGALTEYFDDRWDRASGDAGRIVEPGHQFEWAWILANASRLIGLDSDALIRGLAEFAEKHGVDEHSGATFNQVRDDGRPLDRGSRTWPNTERIKAHIALIEHLGVGSADAIAASAHLLLDRYFSPTVPGLWVDEFDAQGAVKAKHVPASTLYHVYLAFAELLRAEALIKDRLTP